MSPVGMIIILLSVCWPKFNKTFTNYVSDSVNFLAFKCRLIYLEYLAMEACCESRQITGMPRLPKALITPKLLPVTPVVIITAVEWLRLDFTSLLYIIVV